MNQPVGEKRTRTQRNESVGRDSHILWKTFALSSERPARDGKPRECAVSLAAQSQATCRHDRVAGAIRSSGPGDRKKRKTRPGGQPDGSSHMGAWGGWALAPNI